MIFLREKDIKTHINIGSVQACMKQRDKFLPAISHSLET